MAVWAIGDLHGDVECARYWVGRSGLVSRLEGPASSWQWTDPSSRLLFLGDYLDKGPHALQVLTFVKQLTERFPEGVSALMGNHEASLLLDRSRPAGYRYLEHAYGVAHPGQYLDWLLDEQRSRNSSLALQAIYEGLLTVYSKGMYRTVAMTPRGSRSITRLLPASERQIVEEELERWQASYLYSHPRPASLRLTLTLTLTLAFTLTLSLTLDTTLSLIPTLTSRSDGKQATWSHTLTVTVHVILTLTIVTLAVTVAKC